MSESQNVMVHVAAKYQVSALTISTACGKTGTLPDGGKVTIEEPFLLKDFADGSLFKVGLPSQTIFRKVDIFICGEVVAQTMEPDIRPHTCGKCVEEVYALLRSGRL
jgi:hypothetical protein